MRRFKKNKFSSKKGTFHATKFGGFIIQIKGIENILKIRCSHQIPLDEESRLLTTFVTPFGRFCFKRLLFGISSAPEIFQRRMTELLGDIVRVQVIIDDILIHGGTMKEHDKRREETLWWIEESGIKLNPGKCEFRKRAIRYLGHIISDKGIQPSKDKIEVILKLPPPSTIPELKRCPGMTRYLGTYVPNLAEVLQLNLELLKRDTVWVWNKPQENAFQRVKELLTQTPILTYYCRGTCNFV